MGRTIVKQLDPDVIYQERMTKPDKEICFDQGVTQAQLVKQCGWRISGVHPDIRQKGPKGKKEKFKLERDLNTENWDNADHHKVVVPEGFEIVEIGSRPIGAFYDKLGNL